MAEVDVFEVDRYGVVLVITEPNQPPWFLTGIYASTQDTAKRALWVKLGAIAALGYPVNFIGDFHSLTEASEKKGSSFTDLRPLLLIFEIFFLIIHSLILGFLAAATRLGATINRAWRDLTEAFAI